MNTFFHIVTKARSFGKNLASFVKKETRFTKATSVMVLCFFFGQTSGATLHGNLITLYGGTSQGFVEGTLIVWLTTGNQQSLICHDGKIVNLSVNAGSTLLIGGGCQFIKNIDPVQNLQLMAVNN